MKRALLIFMLIASCIYAQDKMYKLVINSNLQSCYIYVNGTMEGRGRVELSVPAGEYRICLKESLIRWTSNEITDTIIIDEKTDKVEKSYSFGEKILLNSKPQNARVFAKDSLLGFTPLYIGTDIQDVTLLKNNYAPLKANINGRKEIDLGAPVNGHNNQFVKSIWFKVLIGSAAVLGTVAAYHKIKADKTYDNYLADGNPQTLSEVNRLDTISGIALGALQINFGVLLYLLLTE